MPRKSMSSVPAFNADQSQNDIPSFYNGSTIFVTGGTGFLGSVLIEKLLRSCTGLKKIYILSRGKKTLSSEDRFINFFDNKIFDNMKKICPDYLAKVRLISGDLEKDNLGISQQDIEILKNEVEIIFHLAATVKFNAPLKEAVKINFEATRDLLEIAKEAKNIKAFVHVSTAFSQCTYRNNFVDEIFYPTTIDAENLIKIINIIPKNTLEQITEKLIYPWKNSYSFSKAITEAYIQQKCNTIPVAVIRPSIVLATKDEPVPGWVNNFYGPTSVVASSAIGLLRSIHLNGNHVCDLVPCDLVVNAMIAVALDVSINWKEQKREKEVSVFNFVSSNQNPIKWGEYLHENTNVCSQMPPIKAIWPGFFILNKYKVVHQFCRIFLHLIPAFIIDTITASISRSLKLRKQYEKMDSLLDVTNFFVTREWKFSDRKIRKLWHRLSIDDKQNFNFDISDVDWKKYIYYQFRGIRMYLLKDSLDTVPKAKEKMYRLKSAKWVLYSVIVISTVVIIINNIMIGVHL